ncbi:putative bacteriophage protein [Nocardia nova SH22a]|uniref:Putative bacteriophage protein n=1 Tax=Nocardia nova SH22a TaxID=1415166 RepID=W5TPB0_9NOCA|nr:hypothetical protein [Nocardia nova]AHH20783.1 putative bacteriophage protein [Nocardia nova SH22a]
MRDQTIEQSHRVFRAGTSEHVLTIKHDDGLYRHLHCAKPGTGIYSFDIVTWPGHLSIGGDLQGYVFARQPDMFDFFATHTHTFAINPGYWSEKVVSGSEQHPERDFCPDVFKATVVEEFMSQRDRFWPDSADLFRRIRQDVIEAGGEYAETAHEALRTFEFHSQGRTFYFSDWWELNTTDWSPHFLRACHAIAWGITEYRKAKANPEAVTVNA